MSRISNYSEQIRGVSYKPEDVVDVLDDTSIMLLRANNIRDGQINFDDVVYVKRNKVSDKQMLRKGDILICASSGSKDLVGKAAQITDDINCTFGAFCKVVRPKDIHQGFFGMYFQSNKYRRTISQASAGANINNIKNEDIDTLEIQIPNADEQEEIYEVLSKVYNVIYARTAELLELDNLIKSRFVDMFGDYDLSHNKNEWKPISQVGKVVGGATPKTNVEEYWDGEYRWITPAELDSDSGYIYDSVRKLTLAGIESCSLQEMPIGTVILSSRAPIGKVAIAGKTFYCNQGFKNIICSEEIVPRYLYTILLLNTKHLNSLGRGATFKEISKSIVESIRIPVPPVEEQRTFEEFVNKVDKLKFEVQKSLEEAQILMNSLMQQYFG